ncbi:hypothetical protein ACROYT_G012753 [Oculina patagonica]
MLARNFEAEDTFNNARFSCIIVNTALSEFADDRDLGISANDDKWHHICTSWENTAGSLKFYKDGVLADTNFKVGHVIRSGGSLILGQDQDSLAGGFQSSQSFQGLMANLNVWDYVLCPEVIARMSNACLSA